MFRYFLKRIVAAIPTLLGISVICFFLIQLTPGGPVEQLMAQWRQSGMGGETSSQQSSLITEEQKQALLEMYGFDKPLVTRYWLWLKKVLILDFGDSYTYNEPVLSLIKKCLPVSLTFGLCSMLATYLVCIPLGILKAVKNNSKFDIFTSGIVFFLYAIPPFAFGILLIVLFGGGSFWNVFPIQGMTSENFSDLSLWGKVKDFSHHMFLPLFCYLIGSFATLTILMKDSLLEQLRMDYITTARAKGLTENKVVLKHALRNALIPIANGLGHWISLFFAGSLLIETIFGLQGIGRLSYDAIIQRDYPIVLANIMILSMLHIVGNLLSDFIYLVVDPRIDFT